MIIMSDKKWTDEQLAAITKRDSNLLVAAAAGAGKTAVLVERIIQRITDPERPVDVDQLLIVTFTNAAATEMRERIGQALGKALNENPHSKRLAKQLTMLNRASITTLHSFCLEIVRRYFYLLDLDPAFRIADDIEAELLRLEVLEALFEERYQREESDLFTTLVDLYGGQRDDSKLQELVLGLYRFASSNPRPQAWLQRLAEDFYLPEDLAIDRLPWMERIKEAIEEEMGSILSLLRQAAWLAQQPGGPAPYMKTLQANILEIESRQNCRQASWDKLYRSFTSLDWGKLSACRGNDFDDGLKNKAKALREKAKDKFEDLKKTYFSAAPEVMLADLRSLYPLVKELTSLTQEFIHNYQRKKQAKGLVDFTDLEHFCLSILQQREADGTLTPSPIAQELKQRYVEVLVDEYQDINAVQETVLQLVSQPANRFMVGDVKQSIYRFRLAEPGLFLGKYLRYGVADNTEGCLIELSKNFRSRRSVVDAVNFVFRQIMTEAAAEIDYNAKAELKCGASYPAEAGIHTAEGAVELHILDRKDLGHEDYPVVAEDEREQSGQSDEQEDLNKDQCEARLVGRRILELVQGTDTTPPLNVWDSHLKKYRPVTFRDMVILLRATSGRANIFLEELRNLGIPAYGELGTGYFDEVEVETFLSLLKIIDNPRQDVPLAAVLRSPMVGLTAAELGEIKLHHPTGDFYDAVLAASQAADELGKRLSEFLKQLEAWRSQARRGSLADLIWQLYRETGYYDYVGGLLGGTQRQANLRVLYHRARQFEATAFRGLFRFLRFVERLKNSAKDLGAARALSENEDVVRIMSIHKSKGLEFPVVFVAGLGNKFNLQDTYKDMLMHKEMGLGPQIINLSTRVSYPSLPKQLIKQQIRKESVAEEMRVLYVALTRAREKLVLVGSVANLAKSLEKWSTFAGQAGWALPTAELTAANNNLDWLGPAVLRHRDGQHLLCLSGSDIKPSPEVAGDPSRWQIYCTHVSELQNLTPDNPAQVAALLEKVQQFLPLEPCGLQGEVERRLSWRYPFARVAAKPAKTSVTELKRRFAELALQEEGLPPGRPQLNNRPRFLQQDRGLSPTERGSALHLVMQHIQLRTVPTEDEVRELLARLVEQEILTDEQAAVIEPRWITEFFQSPLGQRVLQGRAVKRELPFSLAMPAREVYPELPENEEEYVLLQGVIDCLVEERDGLLLIDYKTDAAKPGDTAPAERYREQINIYTRAVEEILDKKVKERAIYLFANGETVYL